MVKIDKNIPIPTFNNKYPLGLLEVGDSFFIKGKNISDISSTISQYGRRKGTKFISRSVDNGVRVWRVQ